MLNLAKLFSSSKNENYLENLSLSEEEKTLLDTARKEIRNALKEGLPGALKELTEIEFTEPRFFTQGSWAYKTLNAPAQHPQQADLDDGCYLPLGDLKEINKPQTATKHFFTAVENVLTPLTQEKGWDLVTTKPTCTRIVINERAHIDIPLYAIPDDEFSTLRKAAMAMDSASFTEAAQVKYETWDDLPDTKVLLAHRVDEWIDSDPRPVKQWFNEQCEVQGAQLRDIVRYLKGFRDHHWKEGGPTSIYLMAIAASTNVFVKVDRRDDLSLHSTLKNLPNEFLNEIKNPINEQESLSAKFTSAQRQEFHKEYSALFSRLDAVINSSDPESACRALVGDFGDRIPYRPDLISVSTATETIQAFTPIITASPLVGRTEAGK